MQNYAQRCAYLENRAKGFDDIVESNNIELKRQSDLIVDLKKQLIVENEKYKSCYILYQKELENAKMYNPDQDLFISSLNKTLQEKEFEIWQLKADKVQLEMRNKMIEDQGFIHHSSYQELNWRVLNLEELNTKLLWEKELL